MYCGCVTIAVFHLFSLFNCWAHFVWQPRGACGWGSLNAFCCRCWDINEDSPYWWIIKGPIVVSIAVKAPHCPETNIMIEAVNYAPCKLQIVMQMICFLSIWRWFLRNDFFRNFLCTHLSANICPHTSPPESITQSAAHIVALITLESVGAWSHLIWTFAFILCHQVNFMLFMNIIRILIQKLNPRLIQFNNSSQYR